MASSNTIGSCSGTKKKLKNTIHCDGARNIRVAIPDDIMMLIVSKLDIEDLQCFSAVCKSWQCIALSEKKIRHLYPRTQLPWLMLSSLEAPVTGFFSLSHGKVLRLELTEAYGARCFGSNWGWLIMVGTMGHNFLLNPFTRVVIELPPQSTLPIQYDYGAFPSLLRHAPSYSHINKAMLLSAPNNNKDDDCVVIAIDCNSHLAFCRIGDEVWTALGIHFEDIIFYNGKLFGISRKFVLKIVELCLDPKVTSCNIPPPADEDLSLPTKKLKKSFYLVECLGELLMVIKCYFHDELGYLEKLVFKIFKLDLKGGSWIKVEDLGDQMLFIGKSTALSISARDYPGFKGNCIYYTKNEEARFVDAFISETAAELVHLEDNRIEPFISNDSGVCLCSPIWFTPFSW
ncbi:putative F-box protein At4g17565 [Macadamia integrifolia]|uniref:putative F-box protein At4g17565 n=1 Tax=Macadamia integrifolia TaxID=60698 RepID=UPI001C4FED94|nr:putative F-box protein At4g17565 [Macadamia integrifolia]